MPWRRPHTACVILRTHIWPSSCCKRNLGGGGEPHGSSMETLHSFVWCPTKVTVKHGFRQRNQSEGLLRWSKAQARKKYLLSSTGGTRTNKLIGYRIDGVDARKTKEMRGERREWQVRSLSNGIERRKETLGGDGTSPVFFEDSSASWIWEVKGCPPQSEGALQLPNTNVSYLLPPPPFFSSYPSVVAIKTCLWST